MLNDINPTTKYTPKKYRVFTHSLNKIIDNHEDVLIMYGYENQQHNVYCDFGTTLKIHFNVDVPIFSDLSTSTDTLLVDGLLDVFVDIHSNYLDLTSELYDQTPKFKVKNLKNLHKHYVSFHTLMSYKNGFTNLYNNYSITPFTIYAHMYFYTFFYEFKTVMNIQNPNNILLKAIFLHTNVYNSIFFMDLLSLLFHSFDYFRKLEYKRVPHKWNPKWTRTLKITTLTHTVFDYVETSNEYPITIISEYEESDIKPDDTIDGGFYANALIDGSVIDDITYEFHEGIIKVLESTEGTIFHTIMKKKQAILERELEARNNQIEISPNMNFIDYLSETSNEDILLSILHKPYKDVSKNNKSYSSESIDELTLFGEKTPSRQFLEDESFLENESDLGIDTLSINFFHHLHNLYSSYRRVRRMWLPLHCYKPICFDDIILSEDFNSNIFFNIFIKIDLNLSSYRLENTTNIEIVLFNQTQTVLSTKTSFMRRPLKKNKKLARYIGIFFLKNYLRTYRKRNILMYFNKLFLTSNSKLSNNYFSWINPKSRKQKHQKNMYLSHNNLRLQPNSNTNDTHKYNNYFPLFGLRKSLFIKYSSVYLDKSSPEFSHFYTYYFIFFLETFLKTRVWFKCNTNARVPKIIAKKLKKLAKKTKRLVYIIGKHLFLLEMYELLWLSLFYKDISLFARWFKILMEKIEFKRHKRMIKIIHNAVRSNKKLFLLSTGTKGFSIDVRGKLGVTGNAKKRHLAFTVGQISITKKKNPLHYYHNLIGTATGVLGVTYFVMS
jgi:hypothetical protein